ncbi:glycerophosphoryl diester phosphodiesterase membrane domain-containing protein [Parabacteroides sp. OttesenSCG-928-G07]|nr:glycerophosphoryl diester phosphodiesterase membrane domain-containing protein [Parabacteroides sp. OttesenSCG-928-G07]
MKRTFTISEVFRTSWKATKSQLAILAGLVIGMFIISLLISLVLMPMNSSSSIGQFISSLLSMIIGIVFSLGYIRNIFQALDGMEPQFSAYSQEARKILTYFFSSLIVGVLVTLGTCVFILPGIYLAIRLQFFLAFIVDEDAGIIDSIKRSWEITKGAEVQLLLLALLMIGIMALGTILFVIGIFIAIPLVYMMHCYSYRKLNPNYSINENDEQTIQD